MHCNVARERFLDWFKHIYMPDDMQWIITGDFNYIRYPNNRSRSGGNFSDMLIINEAINALALVEIPLEGRSFTWSNMQPDPLLEQIDWFLTSLHWTHSYPETLVKPLSKLVSDHIPCVVTIETNIPRSKLFRFESYWILHPGFMDVVQQVWDKPVYNKNVAAKLSHKFKALRHALKIWSKHISRLSIAITNCNQVLA